MLPPKCIRANAVAPGSIWSVGNPLRDALIHATDTSAVLRALGAKFRALPARILVVKPVDQHEIG
jgi:hypothetical protein